MGYLPVNYENLNVMAGTYSPSNVKPYNNKTFAYWERALFQRAASVFTFSVPEEWQGKTKDFLIYCLFKFGYVAISQNDKYGYFFQPCTLSGYNFYYQPSRCLIANPVYNADLKIGKDAELLKLTPDYIGIWDVVSRFSGQLSELDNAINMSIINNKFAYILGAKTKSAAQALKKIFDKINKGEPLVVFDGRIMDSEENRNSESPFQFLERRNLKESYLTDQQLQDLNTILNQFDCEVGIPTIPYEKKERMVSDEATSRVIDAVSRVTVWNETIQGSIKEIKRLYPDLTLDISLRYPDIMKGGIADELGENNADRV